MTFKNRTAEISELLVLKAQTDTDKSILFLLDILKKVDSIEDLMRVRPIIDRICVDSLDDLELGDTILEYTSNYSKAYGRR